MNQDCGFDAKPKPLDRFASPKISKEITIKIAFITDPLASLALKKDSTLAMIKAAQSRNWQVSVLELQDMFLIDGVVTGEFRSLSLTTPFYPELDYQALSQEAGDPNPTDWCQLGEPQRLPLAQQDVIMMRKDPPFDMEYIYATYMLERAEADGALVVNSPGSIRDCNEKFFATAFPQCCPELVVSRREDILSEFKAKHGNVVFKPLDGMGGMSVFRLMQDDPNLKVVLETLTQGGQVQIMGQVYLPEIADGDKRILMVDGEPIPYALARIPKEGEARGNLAAGGRGEGRPLTDRDQWIAEQLGPELRRRGLMFVGIDVIGDYLTEVNVTCPTCIRELDAQFSLDIAGMLMDKIEQKRALRN